MPKIDWMYHRNGWVTCGRTQEFLAKNKIATSTTVDAKKATIPGKDALSVLDGMSEVVAMKGKKVVRYDLKKDKPSEADLKAIMIGPTGNLRAPTFKIGKTVVVGFNEDEYRQLLK